MEGGYNTGPVNHMVQPGDKMVDDFLTEEGALFFLNAIGVQGVPKPGEKNGKPETQE